MKVPFVDLSEQYKYLKEETTQAISAVLNKCNFILGEEVDKFEKEFAQFCGVKYAVGVSSGLDAIKLALAAIDIKQNDEVVLPANTYIATALAVSLVNGTPVFVDIDKKTYNIDSAKIENHITPRTKAIIPVHLYGQPADMREILEIAKKYNLLVIEDAAQAHGAMYQNMKTGNLGDIGCFSFYPSKNLGCYGDGGIITTNNAEIYEKLLILRNYGQKEKNVHRLKGYNARLDTIQAAILSVKLKYLEKWNLERQNNAALYNKLLNKIGDVITPFTADNRTHVYHLYIIQTGNRDKLQKFLAENGVQIGIHYPIPIHLQKAYQDLGYKVGDFPISEDVCNKILSLPMYPEISKDQIEFVAETIQKFFRIF